MATKVNLKTVIGARGWREALEREGRNAKHFTLAFEDVTPVHRAFAPMAREQKFDVSEMAIVTAIMAFAYGKALVILPATIAARFQHGTLIGRSDDLPSPEDLRGRRVGVRAYTQTTGVWVRGILQNDYGVASDSIRWITQEGAHVAEYADPPWVKRTDSEDKLPEMVRKREIDGAILGMDLPDDPAFAPIIRNPGEAAKAWYAKHRTVPINHLLVIRKDLASRHPDVVRELWATIKAARPTSSGTPDMYPLGIEAFRPAVDLLLTYCEQQSLLPRKLRSDEIFAQAAPFVSA
jgi:4,5-dihydroxyphthalate decarboxylase